ncbi:PKD domain-containing protein [Flavitalea sp.]|nr:hypothetical protein [Flavitalea sp.]
MSSTAQVQTPRHTTINPFVHGFYEYLPQGYDQGSASYPLIIFFHGAGERGDGSPSQLPRILSNGVPKMINNGTFPTSFTVNGQTHKFIVISPQFTDVPAWNQNNYVNDVIDYAVRNYRVDASRIYLTGLSMGGGMIFYYFQQNINYTNRIAAIVPIAEAYGFNDGTAKVIADAKVATWLTHNSGDNVINVSPTRLYEQAINKYSPGLAKATIFQVSGHDAWTKTYDLNFREDGKNVFEWMLQFKKGVTTTPPSNRVPTANAGSDKNLSLPTNTVVLNGSGTDSDGSIVSYTWSKESGPTQFTFSNTGIMAPTLSNLVSGTYVFKLTVKDNREAVASDVVTVNVSPASNKLPTANAGSDKNITLPTNNVTLNGSGADADGTITSYSWSKVSGPAQFTLANSAIASPVISNLITGTYTFKLTVKDNNNVTASDDVNIVVNGASTPPPTGTSVQRVLIDFGPAYSSTGLDTWGKQWNNITSALPGVQLRNAKSIKNESTSIGLEVINRIDGTFGVSGTGINGGNNIGIVGDYPATSTSDFAFAHYTTTSGKWKIFGLDATKEYSIKFWGTKSSSANYSVLIKRSDESSWKEYNAANNKDFNNGAVFSFKGKTELTFDIKTKATDYLAGFGYISVVDINTISGGTNTSAPPTTSQPPSTEQVSILKVSPVPTQNNLVLSINNTFKGKLLIQVLDSKTGTIKQTINSNKSSEGAMSLSLNVGSLPLGVYLVRVWFGYTAEKVQFIKE